MKGLGVESLGAVPRSLSPLRFTVEALSCLKLVSHCVALGWMCCQPASLCFQKRLLWAPYCLMHFNCVCVHMRMPGSFPTDRQTENKFRSDNVLLTGSTGTFAMHGQTEWWDPLQKLSAELCILVTRAMGISKAVWMTKTGTKQLNLKGMEGALLKGTSPLCSLHTPNLLSCVTNYILH